MKLWEKLSLLTVVTLFTAVGGFGAMVVNSTVAYNQDKALESGEQQLNVTAYALGRELENSGIENYSIAAKHSYLNLVMRRYGASDYILLEGNQVACNLSPFEMVSPEDERWASEEIFSIIQREGRRYTLLAAKKVPMVESMDYKLVLVQDISALYEDIRRQAFFYFLAGIGMIVLAVLFIFTISKKLLEPMRELQRAAEDLSGGNLKRRIVQLSKDEVGAVARTFNQMAECMERQVSDLSMESERRRQMLGSLTHELKTPMTSIIGYADSLLHVNLKEEQRKKALQHIYEECRRLERLSGKLMSLIGMYDNDSIHKQETEMAQLFREAARLEEYSLQSQHIKLEIFCDMKNYVVDRDLMVSLLVNLIDNAIHASREGDVVYLIGKENVITVKDEGVGIPEEDIDRITEAFYTVDKARSRQEGGSGLGLALCSMIAKLHGAMLQIESCLGEGTEVSLILP